VDSSAGEVQASRPPAEERIVEETPQPAAPAADDLSYAKRLEGDRVEDALERPAAPAPAATARPSAPPATVAAAARPVTPPAREAAAPAKPAPTARPAAAAPTVRATAVPRPAAVAAAEPSGSGSFTIQVGAFKDGASAESVVGRLKQKGFDAYVVAPAAADGLFNVRVGNYRARADAERIQTRLRDEEKFKPFIVTK
jgi:cell division protein FtsN